MAYNINLTNGQNLVTVADGTVDVTTCSLALVGKNYAGYGEYINENYIKLLENFSNSSVPLKPLQGQLWWDSKNKSLKVCLSGGDSSTWKPISGTAVGPMPESSTAVNGDLWWDEGVQQLKVYQDTQWIVIGPAYTSVTGKTGAIADVMTDSVGTKHFIIKFFINNELVAVLSKTLFTPVETLTGFPQIKAGFNLPESLGLKYYGTADHATDSDNLGAVPANQYARKGEINTFTQTITVPELKIGTDTLTDFSIGVSGNNVNLISTSAGKNLNFAVNVGGTLQTLLTLNGTTGQITVASDPTQPMGIATKQYVDNQDTLVRAYADNGDAATLLAAKSYADAGDAATLLAANSYTNTQLGNVTISATGPILYRDGQNKIIGNITPDANNTRDFGSASLAFNTIYATTFNGTSIQAQYADLAERFEADKFYTPGTVVELGGAAEITAAMDDLSDNVFGVVSTKAAYLMNANAGDDESHPPVAMQGRVPVRVIGKVAKGDRLVSAGNGLARAASRSEVTSFNVIGRALQNKTTVGEGTVEAIVKLNS